MSKKVRLNLSISENTKKIAQQKAKHNKISISKLFAMLVYDNMYISDVDISKITHTNIKLNEIEQHLYQIKKILFETVENNVDIKTEFNNLKNKINIIHADLTNSIDIIETFIFEFLKRLKEV